MKKFLLDSGQTYLPLINMLDAKKVMEVKVTKNGIDSAPRNQASICYQDLWRRTALYKIDNHGMTLR